MKFRAIDNASGITTGHIYYGQIIWKVDGKGQNERKELKIVVYNDNGRWSVYSPSKFEPADD